MRNIRLGASLIVNSTIHITHACRNIYSKADLCIPLFRIAQCYYIFYSTVHSLVIRQTPHQIILVALYIVD